MLMVSFSLSSAPPLDQQFQIWGRKRVEEGEGCAKEGREAKKEIETGRKEKAEGIFYAKRRNGEDLTNNEWRADAHRGRWQWMVSAGG